jgi:nucleoside-diphosphate-sugar epimerase
MDPMTPQTPNDPTPCARALVTGASGFLGRHLCRALRAQGIEPVRVTSRPVPGGDPQARWVRCDLLDADRTREVVAEARPDRIYHLAGFASADASAAGARKAFDLNVRATSNLMFAAVEAAPSARVVSAGTLDAGGLSVGQRDFWSPYGASKQMVELTGLMLRESQGLDVVFARIGNTYGPDEPNERRLVPHVILGLLQGRPPSVSSGLRRCDWIHVDDTVQALLRIAERPGPLPPSIDVGTGVLTSVRQLVGMICELSGTGLQARFGQAADRPGDGIPADIDATRAALGWAPSIPLLGGLAATYHWYRRRELQRTAAVGAA